MKKLLIVCHAPSPRIRQLADAVLKGARSIEDIDTIIKSPFDTAAEDLIAADGIIFGTPENFGYMSGALKDLFDRTFYACEGKVEAKPYALFVSAGLDGTGTVMNVERICVGMKLKKVFEPIVALKANSPETLAKCEEMGATLAAGVAFGVF
jgi:multimeric flavodoxin WrbA